MLRRRFNQAFAASAVGVFAMRPAAALIPSMPGVPELDFAGAQTLVRRRIAADAADPAIAPTALPRLYVHGGRVRDAVILFHGFTNCPQQFDELARLYHARGCSVYVPRIPRHGMKDRLTWALAGLTDAELQACMHEAYAVGRGLGERVSAVGLSLGGSMALWMAQLLPVDLSVPVSPFLMPIGVPRWLGTPAMHALQILPDMYWWWDPRIKEKCLPDYAYPGFPSRTLGEVTLYGNGLFKAAASAKPMAKRCTLVTNANESAVNNGVTRELFAVWNGNGVGYGEVVLSGLGAPRHDIIDPTTFPRARTLVYPKLVDLVIAHGPRA